MNEMDELALEELEQKRKNTYGNIKLFGFISILAFALAFIAYVSDRATLGIGLASLGLVFLGMLAYLYQTIKKEIADKIYQPIFEELNLEFEYQKGLDLEEVLSSGLFEKPDEYDSYGLIKGVVLDFPFKASNISLWEVEEDRDSEGNTRTVRYLIFSGRLYIIDTPFNKRKIIVTSGRHNLPSTKGMQKTKLESEEFNKLFRVLAEDQIEVRKVLTPNVMERFIDLRKRVGKFHVSIIENKVYVAIEKSMKIKIKINKPVKEIIEHAKHLAEIEIESVSSLINTLKMQEEKIKRGLF
ncbi:DUF3137 domain-containing protein [Thermocrinis sp.]|jgi:hypothetical protein|uniref:DUF3137 domain-containing protein n=1 Tax=Thermocrinis sp. TaxID=2024383 RepID=UPI003C08AC97